ncbi:uncharacterized protein LOC141641706 [Silene latifolia]|uniref:uncharacterized protein LOC141641706 n=1 Tax=Silene latifolia TaxID=37657 RepID=UPI003D787BF4
MRVAELMQPNGGGWDMVKINNLFLPFERERITNIQLSSNDANDFWYWGLEKDGLYTVTSAYKLLAGEAIDWAETSARERERWLWNRMWQVLVWPRVKLFFWQLCNEALATKANIAARIGSWVWEGLGLFGEEEGRPDSIRGWIEMLWKEMERANYGLFMIGCWAIWEHWNKVIFEDATVDPAKIIKRVRDVACEDAEWRDDHGSKGGVKGRREDEGSRGSEGWKPAPVGYVKINVDAGAKEGEGVSTGAVCRNRNGEVVWGMAVVREQSWDPHIAEAVAVLDGLQEAMDRVIQDVVLESDCLQDYYDDFGSNGVDYTEHFITNRVFTSSKEGFNWA